LKKAKGGSFKRNIVLLLNRIFNEKASGGFEPLHSLNIAVHFLNETPIGAEHLSIDHYCVSTTTNQRS
jgi:hypothetical protein